MHTCLCAQWILRTNQLKIGQIATTFVYIIQYILSLLLNKEIVEAIVMLTLLYHIYVRKTNCNHLLYLKFSYAQGDSEKKGKRFSKDCNLRLNHGHISLADKEKKAYMVIKYDYDIVILRLR